ncbi:hypothetical protein MMC30_002726 [Trapelia coarctata]|nr:hypothetical protein [Trapelia coarctata]
MLPRTPTLLLLSLLLSHAASTRIGCYFQRPCIFSDSDCDRAIALIPSLATFTFDPAFPGHSSSPKPLDLHLSTPSHQRTYVLPAAFHAGSCIVLVTSTTRNRSRLRDLRPPKGVKAATEMHTKVWPVAKARAAEIVDFCQLRTHYLDGMAGRLEERTLLKRWPFSFQVTVRGAPHRTRMAGRGKVRIWGVSRHHYYDQMFNVYE